MNKYLTLIARLAFCMCGSVLAVSASAQAAPPQNATQGQVNATPTLSNNGDAAARLQLLQQQQVERQRHIAAPAPGPTPFQGYVEQVSGQALPVFGRNLFNSVPDTFAPADAMQVNPDYVIGTGDELQVRGWGMIDIDVTATVDRTGSIYIPRVGAVKVAGIKYRDLQAYLKSAIGRNFNGFDLSVSVAQTRAVQVYVVGHAVRPGTYTLSAMSTLLNALFTSGGPDSSGTLRNIEVKRGGKVVTTFDLYDMIIRGDKSRDIALQDGDVIHIPEAGALVALSGNVKNPAIYELKGGTTLADVVGWAGGFDAAAENKQVVIEKNVDNKFQTIAQVSADNSALARNLAGIRLQPADVIRVFAPGAVPIQAKVTKEYVQVYGEVQQTGVIELRKGETLRELLTRLGGATENGYLFAMQLRRESVRQAQQQRLNEVADRFEHDLEQTANSRLAKTTDSDNAAKINMELERMRQQAERLRQVKAAGRIVLELEDGNAQVKNLPQFPLQDGDVVYVPRKPGTVDVLGAVFQQNSFIYKPNRSVKDYIGMAGGTTETADMSEAYVIRADGTAESGRTNHGWFNSFTGSALNPGDAVVVPEKVDRSSWTQSLKEWTAILYQFGLGAAGLKVLKN